MQISQIPVIHLSLSALPDLNDSSNESGIKTMHTAIDSPQQLVKRSVYDFLCESVYSRIELSREVYSHRRLKQCQKSSETVRVVDILSP